MSFKYCVYGHRREKQMCGHSLFVNSGVQWIKPNDEKNVLFSIIIDLFYLAVQQISNS